MVFKNQVSGDLRVFESCPSLREVLLEGCEDIEGSVACFYKCPRLELVDLTNTSAEGSVSVFEKLAKTGRFKKAKVGGTRCYEGLPPSLRSPGPAPKRTHGSF